MWGTDQAASVEIVGLVRLVANIRDIEQSLGDGVKRVYREEITARRKLRRVDGDADPGHADSSNGLASRDDATNGVIHGAP